MAKRKFKNKSTTISKPKKKRVPAFEPNEWDEVLQEGSSAPDHKATTDGDKDDPRKKYPPPSSSNGIFVSMWNDFIVDVVERENFKIGHLHQLQLLCDLYVEAEKLQSIIDRKGYTYESDGRGGFQIKPRPEVQLLNRSRAEIRSYSKMLGLLLYKDKEFTDPDEKEESWE